MNTIDNINPNTKSLINICDDTLIIVYAINNNLTTLITEDYESISDSDFYVIDKLIKNIKAQYKLLCNDNSINNILDYLKLFYKLINLYSSIMNEFYKYISNSNHIEEKANKEDTTKHIDFDEDDNE